MFCNRFIFVCSYCYKFEYYLRNNNLKYNCLNNMYLVFIFTTSYFHYFYLLNKKIVSQLYIG